MGKGEGRNNLEKCQGITRDRNICGETAKPCYVQCNCKNMEVCECEKSQKYCDVHVYQEIFTKKELSQILAGTSNYKQCDKCKHWKKDYFEGKRCPDCKQVAKAYEEEKRDRRQECCVMIKRKENEIPTKCKFEILDKKKYKMCKETKKKIYLLSEILEESEIDHESEFAQLLKKENIFCAMHLKKYIEEMYQNEQIYTEDDVSDFKWCSTCRNYLNTENFNDCSVCNNCDDLRKKNIEKIKIKHDRCEHKECIYEAIKYKIRDENEQLEYAKTKKLSKLYEKYCGNHQVNAWITEIANSGKKVCNGYERGCRKILELSDLTFCNTCREERQKYDKMKWDEKKENAIEKENELNKNGRYYKICLYCPFDEQVHLIEDFVDDNTEYSMCRNCRIYARQRDLKRVGQKRNWKEELKNNPERKAKRDLWKKINTEKIKEHYVNGRITRKERMGLEAYNKLMNEQRNEWRKRNPEKYKAQRERTKMSLVARYGIYKHSAKIRGKEFRLTQEQCSEFFTSNCAVCNEKSVGLCGIDRIDNTKDYIYENCRACCTMCNYMKNDYEDECFLKKVEHILNNIAIIKTEDGLCPELFDDHINIHHWQYKHRSGKKEITFNLTMEDFILITSSDCYLCGKETSDIHKNGIDRVDSCREIGYIVGNMLPCCTDCNMMKNKYTLYEFISKLYKIYIKRNNLPENVSSDDIKKTTDDYVRDRIDEINTLITVIEKKLDIDE